MFETKMIEKAGMKVERVSIARSPTAESDDLPFLRQMEPHKADMLAATRLPGFFSGDSRQPGS